jgi:hypothetical protein
MVALVSALGILANALPERREKTDGWKRQSPNRLVFAHFMVRLKTLVTSVPKMQDF